MDGRGLFSWEFFFLFSEPTHLVVCEIREVVFYIHVIFLQRKQIFALSFFLSLIIKYLQKQTIVHKKFISWSLKQRQFNSYQYSDLDQLQGRVRYRLRIYWGTSKVDDIHGMQSNCQ